MTPWEILALFSSALAAGAINAVAGGGTVLTFPALLASGCGAVAANATSTLALTLGTMGSLFGFRHQWSSTRPWLRRFIPVCVLGGLLGSALVQIQGEAIFVKAVPWLLLFATSLFLAQRPLQRWSEARIRRSALSTPPSPFPAPHLSAASCIALQAGVALYGGYFGAGIGILMLALLAFMGLSNIHQMNALKNMLGATINATASLYFALSGLVDWPRAGIMVAGALLGYWFGAHYSQKIPQATVRTLVVAIGLAISASMFYKLLRA